VDAASRLVDFVNKMAGEGVGYEFSRFAPRTGQRGRGRRARGPGWRVKVTPFSEMDALGQCEYLVRQAPIPTVTAKVFLQEPNSALLCTLWKQWANLHMLDMMLFLDGIPGSATLIGFPGWHSIIAFSWGASNDASQAAQIDAHAAMQDLSLTKYVDGASGLLARHCTLCERIDVAILEVTRPSDMGPQRIVRYTMRDCYVSSVSTGASGGEDVLTENVTLGYSRIEIEYGQPDEAVPTRTTYVLTKPPESEIPSEPRHSATTRPQASPIRQLNQFIPKTAFIVMWMDPSRPELEDVHLTIKEICKQYGIVAKRADDVQHDDRITDVILEHINSSEFIVADLTGERPNVYYEVGHAHAIGKRPILLRRIGSALHFDLAAHNVREYRNVTELREILSKRFHALLG